MTKPRTSIVKVTDIPNVRKATLSDFDMLGLKTHADLIAKNTCSISKMKQDPCVIDVFISAVRYMESG